MVLLLSTNFPLRSRKVRKTRALATFRELSTRRYFTQETFSLYQFELSKITGFSRSGFHISVTVHSSHRLAFPFLHRQRRNAVDYKRERASPNWSCANYCGECQRLARPRLVKKSQTLIDTSECVAPLSPRYMYRYCVRKPGTENQKAGMFP